MGRGCRWRRAGRSALRGDGVRFTRSSAAGWDGTQFDVYRVQMKYPPIPATMIIKHNLPERPAD